MEKAVSASADSVSRRADISLRKCGRRPATAKDAEAAFNAEAAASVIACGDCVAHGNRERAPKG